MTTIPSWNDPSIPDEEWLYRRVPRKVGYYEQLDLVSKTRRLGRAAFRFDSDGMSVYRHGLIVEHRLTAFQIRRNGDYDLWRFQVGDARKLETGVVDDPDLEDQQIGVAHASVRCHPDIRPREKSRRRAIALGLIAVAEFVNDEISSG